MGACVMLPQQIAPKVALEIAPDRVDVIGLVLDIVVLDNKRRTLDPVVMRLPRLEAAGPPEIDLTPARLTDGIHPRPGAFRRPVSGGNL